MDLDKPYQIKTKWGTATMYDGHYQITSRKEGNQGKPLHRLIYEEHHGKIPKGKIIHHIDKNPANNDISNLEMLTPSEHSKIHMSKENNPNWGRNMIDAEGGLPYLIKLKSKFKTLKNIEKNSPISQSMIYTYLRNRDLKWSLIPTTIEYDERGVLIKQMGEE